MQNQTDDGERIEREWYSKLYSYKSRYPQEAVELNLLLSGGLLPGWENSLPVNNFDFMGRKFSF